jgi:hypothetical protein
MNWPYRASEASNRKGAKTGIIRGGKRTIERERGLGQFDERSEH